MTGGRPKALIRYDPAIQLGNFLSDSGKVLYNYLQYRIQFFTMNGLDFMESIGTISQAVGWSESKTRRYIRELEKNKLIVVTQREHKTNIIKLMLDII